MDYEKKYKEALGWIGSLYPTMEGAVREDAEHYFPELKESEDEMIRKALVRFHKSTIDVDGIKGEDIIAWLEKAAMPTSQDWNDYKDKPVELWNMYVKGLANGIERGKQAVKNHPQDYGLEKQSEQKPITDFSDLRTWKYIVDVVLTEKEGIGQYLDRPFTEEVAKKLQERFGNIEQIHTGWSEEDEAMFQGVIETEQYMLDVVYGCKTFDVGNVSIKKECAKELAWLKSIKDRIK